MTDSTAGTPITESSGAASPKTDRTLLVVLVIIGVLVVAAVVAVLVRGAAPEFEANSPEGVVQRYVSAVVTDDLQTARDLHASKLGAGCDPVPSFVGTDTRVTLVKSTASGDSATVTVTINDGVAGPFGSDGGYEDGFELVADGDSWLVSYAPWQFQVCVDAVVK